MTSFALACRDTARGLLRTARVHKEIGQPSETARLVKRARFYWRRYIWEICE